MSGDRREVLTEGSSQLHPGGTDTGWHDSGSSRFTSQEISVPAGALTTLPQTPFLALHVYPDVIIYLALDLTPNTKTFRETDWQKFEVLGIRRASDVHCILADNPRILHLFYQYHFLISSVYSSQIILSTPKLLWRGISRASIFNEIQPQRSIPLCAALSLLIYFWVLKLWDFLGVC